MKLVRITTTGLLSAALAAPVAHADEASTAELRELYETVERLERRDDRSLHRSSRFMHSLSVGKLRPIRVRLIVEAGFRHRRQLRAAR